VVLALLAAHHIFHISSIKVKKLIAAELENKLLVLIEPENELLRLLQLVSRL
jgi:hypothetical protein